MKKWILRNAQSFISKINDFLLNFSLYLDRLKRDRFKQASIDNENNFKIYIEQRILEDLESRNETANSRRERYLKTGKKPIYREEDQWDILASTRNSSEKEI